MPPPPGGWSQPPPMPVPGGAGGRFSISIRNGKVHIDGLEGFARHHLESVREMIRNNPNIPPDVRDKVLARLDTARAIVERRLRNLSSTDLDKLGDEMEKMGDELEKAMEGLEDEMEKLGEKLGKDLAKKLGKDIAKGLRPGIRIDGRDHDHDHDHDRGDGDDGDDSDDDGDDDHARGVVINPGVDMDTRGAIRDLPDLTLRPAQREQIVKLRSSYEQEIARARKQLDDASKRLEIALADLRTSDADIEKYVDQVSKHEAAIRKARLLTWVNARRLLDETQRKKIEDASGKRHR
jgi:DNA gyrase/topoisomerase IV subunit A